MSLPTPYYDEDGITIYHANCVDILPYLPVADLLLVDPPYGIGEAAGKNHSRGQLAIPTDYGNAAWDNQRITDDLMGLVLGSADQSIVWGGNYYSHLLSPGPGWLVWDKINSGDFADCELAWTNLPQAVRLYRHMWNGMLRDSERNPRVHPTQKPVALMHWCLSFAPDAETIIDPFCGSGPVLRAAKDLGRKCVGIEIEERYCEIAVRRLAQTVLPLG